MLNRIVPTCWKIVPAASVFALKAKTSRSGRENGTWLFQLRPSTSTQFVPLNLTMTPVSGAAADAAFVLGPGTPPGTIPLGKGHAVAPAGGGSGVPDPAEAKPLRTHVSRIEVVWLPEWNAAT